MIEIPFEKTLETKKSGNQRKTRESIRLLLFFINVTQVILPPNLLVIGDLRLRFLLNLRFTFVIVVYS